MAQAKRPERTKLSAYNLLALDGCWAPAREQLGQAKFNRMIKEEAQRMADQLNLPLVSRVEEEFKPIHRKNFGVERKYVSENLDDNAIRWVYNGHMNAYVPDEILDRQNNVLPLYVGIWRGKWERDERGRPRLQSNSLYELVSECLKIGYANLHQHQDKKDKEYGLKDVYSRKDQPLKVRLQSVSKEAEKRFKEEIKKPLRKPMWKDGRKGWQLGDFHVPEKIRNKKGELVIDRKGYARKIFNYFKEREEAREKSLS